MSGNTVVVGSASEAGATNGIIHGDDLSATNDDEGFVGAAYVFVRDDLTGWSHQAYLKAPNAASNVDPVENQEWFGFAVDIDGDTVVVGAYNEKGNTTGIIHGSDLSLANDSGDDNGAVYVFRRTGSTWTHEAYLKAPNSSEFDRFGMAVAIDGDTIAVGVPAEDSSTTAIINGDDLTATDIMGWSNGAVYVFRRTGSTWTHEAYLKAPNGANQYQFGTTVAISGDTIVVGSNREDSDTTDIISGADLSGANDTGDDNGAAYVFTRSGTTWTHQAYLKAPNSSDGDQFGAAVAIFGDTIAVGAFQEDSDTTQIIHGADLSATNDNRYSGGAVYVFTRSGTTWTHQAYLKPPRISNGDSFGQKLALYENIIAIGAPDEASTANQVIYGTDLSSANDAGNGNGAVYLFDRTGTNWAFTAYVKPPNNSDFDSFGWSVAVDSNRVMISSDSEGSNTNQILSGEQITTSTNDDGLMNGAVYLFEY
ncbi:MAG: hypothetical protein GY854_27565 [Deltaproteobacteria bacterium]|nr:hypothetical protein [Deltaproteobacteria bacterium]